MRRCKIYFKQGLVDSSSKMRMNQQPPLRLGARAKDLFSVKSETRRAAKDLWLWSAADLYAAVRHYAEARDVDVALEEDELCVVLQRTSPDDGSSSSAIGSGSEQGSGSGE